MKRATKSTQVTDGSGEIEEKDITGPVLWGALVVAIWFILEVSFARASYDVSLSKNDFSEHIEGLVLVPLLSHVMSFYAVVIILSVVSFIAVFGGLVVAIFYTVEADKADGALLQGLFFLGTLASVFVLVISAVSTPTVGLTTRVDALLSAQGMTYEENYRLDSDNDLASISNLLEDDSQVDKALGEDIHGKVYVSENKNHDMTVYYATNKLKSPSDLEKVGTIAQNKKNVVRLLIENYAS